MLRSHRLCFCISRDHQVGLPDCVKTIIVGIIVAANHVIKAAMIYDSRGIMEKRAVLMMKTWTQIWASVILTISRKAIMKGLLDVLGVEIDLLGIWLWALRNE